MIYLRKILDMFFLSMVPSLISFLLMSQFIGYTTWFIMCIISTLVFFIGNALLIRRFVRDIKSTATYYMVWLTIFVIYVAGGALCLWQDWMYPFTWIYFHTRILSVLTTPTAEIPVWISFVISMSAYLILIFALRPIFLKRYIKEVAENEEQEREARRQAREEHKRREREKAAMTEQKAASASSGHSSSSSLDTGSSHHHHHREDDENALYTMRQYRKLEMLSNLESTGRRKHIGVQRASGKKMTRRMADFFLNIGSYEFYQVLAEKVEQGNDPWPIIKIYLKRRLSLGLKASKRR